MKWIWSGIHLRLQWKPQGYAHGGGDGSVDGVLIRLARRVVSGDQEEREERAGHKQRVKPTMVEVKLDVSAQNIGDDDPAGQVCKTITF